MLDKVKLLAHEMTNVFRQMPTEIAIKYAVAVLLSSPRVIANRSLNAADRKMTSVQLKKFGRWYYFDEIPFALIRELYLNEIYFLTPKWRPEKGDLVVDLGANRGTFSVLCAGMGASVIAVEALPDFRSAFEQFADRNGVRDQIDYHLGLLCEGHGVFDAEHPHHDFAISTPAAPISISQILVSRGVETVALVKADIEGAEFRLPEDETGLLGKAARIAMEVHTDFGNPTVLAEQLRALGFSAKLFDKWGAEVSEVQTPIGFLYAWRTP